MGRIYLCFVLLFVVLSVSACAEGASIMNNVSSGPGYGVGYSVRQTNDSGYIIAGTKYSMPTATGFGIEPSEGFSILRATRFSRLVIVDTSLLDQRCPLLKQPEKFG